MALQSVNIRVEYSWMTLESNRIWDYQRWAEREQAANAAYSSVNVTGDKNHIKTAAPTWSGN